MEKLILKDKEQTQFIPVKFNKALKINLTKGLATIVLKRADGSAKGTSINSNEFESRIIDIKGYANFMFEADGETIIEYELSL
jgi:hypothetical protein